MARGPTVKTGGGAKTGTHSATTGYEAELWRMADALRGSMDAAEYKHVVLGLIFLKYISDAFEERHAAVLAEWGADAAEDRDEYTAENIFWVPPEARWTHLKAQARQATIGQLVDDAMTGIERDNPVLKDVLPKDYARPALDKQRLGQLIDMISNIKVGDEDARSKDVLGRIYEYFLSQFASAEGKKGGEFYTPRCIVKLLVEMLEPYQGRVYDPCCGSSGMFVQSVEFIDAHATGNGNGGSLPRSAMGDISIYGQESNYTTWRLAKMNLAIRGIEGQIAHGESFHNDRHPDLKAGVLVPLGRGEIRPLVGSDVILWHAPAGTVHEAEGVLRFGVALVGGKAEPTGGFTVVLQNAAPIGIHQPEVEMRSGVTLVSGEAVPAEGFTVVLRSAATIAIHYPEAELRFGVTLVGGKVVPAGGFTVVLRNAFAVEVHESEAGLRSGVTLLGREVEPSNGLTVVLRNAFAVEVPVAEVELRGSVTRGSEAAQSGHVRRVLAADERYCRQQPDAARRRDQPAMSSLHDASRHFLILIVRARLVKGCSCTPRPD